MNEIGGYFGLELKKGKEYHANAIKLNTGRNAFEYILEANNYSKVYIPYYTCDALLQPITKLKIAYEFYSINEDLEPLFDFKKIKKKEVFLYTNYFGLKDKYILELYKNCKNLIIDNSQAFFSNPLNNIDTFYTARKFFGVSDGAYLYIKKKLLRKLAIDNSLERTEHLLRRIENSAQDGYPYFVKSDDSLNNLPILKMSKLTQRILESVDYKFVALKRKSNYNFLNRELKNLNLIRLSLGKNQVPMVYPFLTNNTNLRAKLTENNIYTAQYWPNVLKWVDKKALEYKYSSNLIHLPIDQRYVMILLK